MRRFDDAVEISLPTRRLLRGKVFPEVLVQLKQNWQGGHILLIDARYGGFLFCILQGGI